MRRPRGGADQALRRCRGLELRVSPAMGPEGGHWRCAHGQTGTGERHDHAGPGLSADTQPPPHPLAQWEHVTRERAARVTSASGLRLWIPLRDGLLVRSECTRGPAPPVLRHEVTPPPSPAPNCPSWGTPPPQSPLAHPHTARPPHHRGGLRPTVSWEASSGSYPPPCPPGGGMSCLRVKRSKESRGGVLMTQRVSL